MHIKPKLLFIAMTLQEELEYFLCSNMHYFVKLQLNIFALMRSVNLLNDTGEHKDVMIPSDLLLIE
jgi:glycerol-3-phosphate responsive antiterminator